MPYHPFPNGQVSLYHFGVSSPSYTSYYATRIDSVRPDGVDSLYYLYRTMRQIHQADTLVNCQMLPLSLMYPRAILVNLDHRLGKFMRLKPNGDCEFVYSSGDTFLLQTQATTGQSWAWGAGVTATVDTVKWEAVLSQGDSVKHIALSNGQEIKLSRRFGLVKGHPFKPLVDQWGNPDTLSFHLADIPMFGMGMHLPTFDELYQHQPGDEWVHTFKEGNLGAPGYGGGYMYHTQILDTIPGTHYQYQIFYEQMQYHFTPQEQVYGPVIHSVIDTIGFDEMSFDPLRHMLPGEWNPACECAISILWYDQQFNHRLQYGVVSAHTVDTCSQAYLYSSAETHVEGVGSSIWSVYFDGGDFQRRDLNCFVHGSETWGVCPDFHALSLPEPAASLDWSVWPNPAHDRINLRASAAMVDREFELVAADGRRMKRVVLPAGNQVCEVLLEGLEQGIYWLREAGGAGKAIFLMR